VPKKRKRFSEATAARRSWEDIVVVPRKDFSSDHRFELAPFSGDLGSTTL